jgi:hypothetical protein
VVADKVLTVRIDCVDQHLARNRERYSPDRSLRSRPIAKDGAVGTLERTV